MQVLLNILNNNCFVCLAMAVIVFLVTQVLKLPIKFGTKHIKNERVRKIVNSVILLIPFGIGILGQFLYATFYLHTAFDVLVGLGYGTAGISLYGIVERFFKVKVKNPYDTEEGKAVTELIENLTKEEQTEANGKSAVQEFLEKVKK